MFKIITLVLFISCSFLAVSQTNETTTLYGSISKEKLEIFPFNKWFDSGYSNYSPNLTVMNSLHKMDLNHISIKIFFGTWCSDSKREVPRMFKILDNLSIPKQNIQLIAVGGDSLYKQSPEHEESGLGIFRVPTIIVYKNGIEINRINESPSFSIEKDLQMILSGKSYQPNLLSLAVINEWLHNGSLVDENISLTGLASKVRNIIVNENELNTVGYVLLSSNQLKEALKIFLINNILYPNSSRVVSSLGQGYLKNGEVKKGISFLENSLAYVKSPKEIKDILNAIYEAKELK